MNYRAFHAQARVPTILALGALVFAAVGSAAGLVVATSTAIPTPDL